MSGDINAGFLGGPVGLCSSSFLSDVSVARSLCPYTPSPSPPSSPLHSPQSVRCPLLFILLLLPLLLDLVVMLLQHQLEAGDIAGVGDMVGVEDVVGVHLYHTRL